MSKRPHPDSPDILIDDSPPQNINVKGRRGRKRKGQNPKTNKGRDLARVPAAIDETSTMYQVLRMTLDGYTIKEISEELQVSEGTVKGSRNKAYEIMREEVGVLQEQILTVSVARLEVLFKVGMQELEKGFDNKLLDSLTRIIKTQMEIVSGGGTVIRGGQVQVNQFYTPTMTSNSHLYKKALDNHNGPDDDIIELTDVEPNRAIRDRRIERLENVFGED